jgi:hypothetical protein
MAVTLEKQKVRAKITIGSEVMETPDVVSFRVSRARGQMSASFSATVRVDYDLLASTTDWLAEEVVIEAGEKPLLRTIFTGVIYKVAVNPIRTDASKVMLSLSGRDKMSVMEGQKINRRVKTYRDGSTPPERWGSVTSVLKHNTPHKQKFPVKVWTPKDLGVNELPNLVHIELTPDSIQRRNEVVRHRALQIIDQIQISKWE